MKVTAYQSVGERSVSIDVEFDSTIESDCREANANISKLFQIDGESGGAVEL